VTLEPGEALFEPGDDSERLYLVTIGLVTERRGGEVVGEHGPWKVVGIRALFEQEARSTQATAVSLSRLKAIKRSDIMAAVAKDPTLAARVYRNLAVKVLREADTAASR
jgi:CRP-like cAMP-binding protein